MHLLTVIFFLTVFILNSYLDFSFEVQLQPASSTHNKNIQWHHNYTERYEDIDTKTGMYGSSTKPYAL